MQQFALASVYPRSIAWLIRPNEWDRFEKIVKYNCAMVGGYFNVFIPLTDEDTTSVEYQRFLADYDPDIIVLAPRMHRENLIDTATPFSIITWELLSAIVTLDPLSVRSGMNATTSYLWSKMIEGKLQSSKTIVAVADEQHPDTSRLALAACGDIEPREPMIQVLDEQAHFDATGYREEFLKPLIRKECNDRDVSAYMLSNGSLVPAPDRHKMKHIIAEEYKFPLTDSIEMVKTCCSLQRYPGIYQSFIGLTTIYDPKRHHKYVYQMRKIPSLVVLLSHSFNLSEAQLFWNLRANGVIVVWLSFNAVEKEFEVFLRWLESDSGGLFYSIMRGGSSIGFSSADEDNASLQNIFNRLQSRRKIGIPYWQIISHKELIFYHHNRPSVKEERVNIFREENKYIFIPPLDEDFTGTYSIKLNWYGLMLPKSSNLIDKITVPNQSQYSEVNIQKPKFRITKGRFLAIQTDTEKPIEFYKPTPEQTVEVLFTEAGFSRIERSSAAKYHTSFISRVGGLEKVNEYLAKLPYKTLLDILADNKAKGKLGWILENPSKRRVVHHLQLREILGKLSPDGTKEYFNTVSDELPQEAFHLLEKGLLERGFLLSCSACSFRSWYPAQHVGQTFECTSCLQVQVYDTNPLWLYKLPEVIFRGFEDNMQVPLLALNYLRKKSQHVFEWVPDSNIYLHPNDVQALGNVDLLCLRDGRFYIGEAKSNDVIEPKQFLFYEQLCRQVALDGIVFATSQSHWGRATQQRIDVLKTWFAGEVLVLTEKDLYNEIT